MKVADMNTEQLIAAFAKAHMASYTGGFIVRGDMKMSADIFNDGSAMLLVKRYRLKVEPDASNWYVSYTPPATDHDIRKIQNAEGYRETLEHAVIECVIEIILGKEVDL